MKKALVVFLILAVAGGLFAQVSVGGHVRGGIGIGFTDQEDGASPQINFVRDRGAGGLRGQVTVKYNGETDNFGTYGMQTAFRMTQTLWAGTGIGFDDTFIWWQPNSFVKIRVGQGGEYAYETPAALGNLLQTWEGGLQVRLFAAPGLELGYHGFIGPNGKPDIDKLTHGIGAKYSLDMLDLNASTRIKTATEPVDLDFIVGAKFKGVPGLGIAADIGGFNFMDDKTNFLGGGLKVEYGVGALSLNARGQVFFPLAKELPTGFMPMLIHGGASYKVSDVFHSG